MKYSYQAPKLSQGIWSLNEVELEYIKIKPETEIVGDLRKKASRQGTHELVVDNQILNLEPVATKLSWNTKVVGYVKVADEQGNEGYVRLLQSTYWKLFAAVVVLVALIGGWLGYSYYQRQAALEAQRLVVFDAPGDLINNDPSQVAIPAYTEIYVNAETQKVTSPLINVQGNQVKMKYALALKKNNETIFTTNQILNPGKAFYNFKLKKDLPKGKYKIWIKITNYTGSKKNLKKVNSSRLESTLVVK